MSVPAMPKNNRRLQCRAFQRSLSELRSPLSCSCRFAAFSRLSGSATIPANDQRPRPRSPKALVGTQSHRPLRNTPASSSTGSKRKQFQRCLSILFVRNITYEWKTEPTRSFAWLLFHDLPVPLHRAPQPLAEINDRLIAKQFSRQLNIRQRVSNIA